MKDAIVIDLTRFAAVGGVLLYCAASSEDLCMLAVYVAGETISLAVKNYYPFKNII